MTRAARSGMGGIQSRGSGAGASEARDSRRSIVPFAIVAARRCPARSRSATARGRARGAGARPAAVAGSRAGRAQARPAGSTRGPSRSGHAGAGARARGSRRSTRTTRRRGARADAGDLELLGLLPPGIDLRRGRRLDASARQVAGYYDPRSGRLRVVEGAQPRTACSTRRRSRTSSTTRSRTRASTSTSTSSPPAATRRSPTPRWSRARRRADGPLPGAALQGRGDVRRRSRPPRSRGTGNLPPFLTAQLPVPVHDGEAFVARLLRSAAARWKVVDAAMRVRPPASTEQILHPQKYLGSSSRAASRARPLAGSGTAGGRSARRRSASG